MKKIIIESGHNLSEPGAVSDGYKERDLTIELRDLDLDTLERDYPTYKVISEEDSETLAGVTAIYMIISPSNKKYIGQSINIKSRFKSYKRLHCKKQTMLFNSFKKYGFENHLFLILKECLKGDLNKEEISAINKFNTFKKGMNLTLGGGGINGRRHSETSIDKIKNSGKLRSLEGFIPPNSVAVINLETGVYYDSIIEASKASNLSDGYLGQMLRSVRKNWTSFRLLSAQQTSSYKRRGSTKKVQNIKTGEIYKSIKEACSILGLNPNTINKMLHGKISKTVPLQFLNDTNHPFTPKNGDRRKIIFDRETGVYYFSQAELAECIGVSVAWISKSLKKHGVFKNRFINI